MCYFTARTDGSHTPKCLLEGCIYMETAITIGQMLQDERMKKKNVTVQNETQTMTTDFPESESSI